jgi:hypothetical protein
MDRLSGKARIYGAAIKELTMLFDKSECLPETLRSHNVPYNRDDLINTREG